MTNASRSKNGPKGVFPTSTASKPTLKTQAKKDAKVNIPAISLFFGAFAVSAVIWTYSFVNKGTNDLLPIDEWILDNDFFKASKSDEVFCDFPIVPAKSFDIKRQKNMDHLLSHPFIIRGMMTHWPANERWSKANFTKLYGHKTIKLGSESSIVYGGGSAGLQSELRNVLCDLKSCGRREITTSTVTNTEITSEEESVRNKSASGFCDSFTFDVSVLKSIPELGRDFRVPGTVHQSSTLHWKFLSFSVSSLLVLLSPYLLSSSNSPYIFSHRYHCIFPHIYCISSNRLIVQEYQLFIMLSSYVHLPYLQVFFVLGTIRITIKKV